MNQWVYRISDQQILRGGNHEQEFNPATEGVFSVEEGVVPNPRLHRFNGTLRAATPAEISAYDTAHTDEVAGREIDNSKAIRAAVLCSLWGRLGRQPTGVEIAAERARFLAIYKAL